MTMKIDRRDFLELVGLGGIVFASQLRGWAQAAEKAVGSGSDTTSSSSSKSWEGHDRENVTRSHL